MPATASLDYREDCLKADQGLRLVFLQRVQDRVLSLASVGPVLEVMLLLPSSTELVLPSGPKDLAEIVVAAGKQIEDWRACRLPTTPPARWRTEHGKRSGAHCKILIDGPSALVRYGFCMVKGGLQPARRQILAYSGGTFKTSLEMRAAAENELGKSPEYIGELQFASITSPIAHIFMVDRIMMDREKNFCLAMRRNQRSIAQV